MRKTLPLFTEDAPPAPAQAVYDVTTDTGVDWWALANRVANGAIDAQSIAEIDAAARREAVAIDALKDNRRDLALAVSGIFADRRAELRGRYDA